jgi:hypothetical protein
MIKGLNQKILRQVEGNAKSGSDKDIIASMRAFRDAGKWRTETGKKTQRTTVGAKKIAGKQKPIEVKETLTFRKKRYAFLTEKKTKKEVISFKNDCENACYFFRVLNPKRRGDTYKIYARKKK